MKRKTKRNARPFAVPGNVKLKFPNIPKTREQQNLSSDTCQENLLPAYTRESKLVKETFQGKRARLYDA